MDNSRPVRDLLNLIKSNKKEENLINIYFDIQNLRIKVRDNNSEVFELQNLTYDCTLKELKEQIQNLSDNKNEGSDLHIRLPTGR